MDERPIACDDQPHPDSRLHATADAGAVRSGDADHRRGLRLDLSWCYMARGAEKAFSLLGNPATLR